MNVSKELGRAKGMLMTMAAILSDREVVDGKAGNMMREAVDMGCTLERVMSYVLKLEADVKELEETLESIRDIEEPMRGDSRAVLNAGR